jgi:hypothetical protein
MLMSNSMGLPSLAMEETMLLCSATKCPCSNTSTQRTAHPPLTGTQITSMNYLKTAKEKFQNCGSQLLSLIYAEKIFSMLNSLLALMKPQAENITIKLFEEKLFLKLHSIVENAKIPCLFSWMNRRKQEVVMEHNKSFISLLGFTEKSFSKFIENHSYLQYYFKRVFSSRRFSRA